MQWHVLSPPKLFFFCKIKMAGAEILIPRSALCSQKLSRLQLFYVSYSGRVTFFVVLTCSATSASTLEQPNIPISKPFTVVIRSLGNNFKALWKFTGYHLQMTESKDGNKNKGQCKSPCNLKCVHPPLQLISPQCWIMLLQNWVIHPSGKYIFAFVWLVNCCEFRNVFSSHSNDGGCG